MRSGACFLVALAGLLAARSPVHAGILHKADNTTTLQTAASWTENVAPTSADTLVFDSTITSGPLTVSGYLPGTLGTLQVGDATTGNPAGDVTINWSNTSTFNQSALVDMANATVDLTMNGGFLRAASATYNPTFTVPASRTLTVGSAISNQGNTKTFHFAGAGDIVINSDSGGGGAMNYSVEGPTVTFNASDNDWTYGTVSTGKLVVGHSTALGDQTLTVNVASGLGFGTGVTAASIAQLTTNASGSFDLTNADNSGVALDVSSNNSSTTLSGAIGGLGSLSKSGTGTLTISGVNTFTGGLTVNAGSIVFGNSSAAAGGLVTAANGTTLSLANSSSVFLGGTVTPSGSGAAVTLTSANAAAGFSTLFTGDSDQTLTIAGGTQVNASSSSQQFSGFDGTVAVASGSTLRFSNSGLNNGGLNTTFDLTGGITTRNNGTLTLGALQGAGNIAMGGSGGNNATLNVYVGAKNIDTTYSGGMSDADAVNGKVLKLYKVGTGKLTLSGSNPYTGATSVSAGTLDVSGSLATSSVTVSGGVFNALVADLLPDTSSLSVSSGRYELGGSDTIDTFTISGGELAGAGYTLTASTYNLNGGTVSANLGAGTVNIGGTVQITGEAAGTATVSTGELLVDNQFAGSVTVATGAQLGGSGTITGNVSFGQNALFTFNPSAPLTVGGNVTFTNPADFGVDDIIGLSNLTPEGTYTLIAGTVDTTNLANFGAGNAYDLGSGKSAYFQQGSLQLTVVPEPSAIPLAVGIAAALMRLRQRSRRTG
ncbi:MAG: hypothetical protein RLZZ440_1784 [Planctomycetota bacterium]|jgi:autotransporter-associated beta strand protein